MKNLILPMYLMLKVSKFFQTFFIKNFTVDEFVFVRMAGRRGNWSGVIALVWRQNSNCVSDCYLEEIVDKMCEITLK